MPRYSLLAATLLIGGAVRFIHFALFEATLLSPASFALDMLFLLAVGTLAWRLTRVKQMVTQYDWLYERAGPLAWREKAVGERPPTDAFSG